MSDHGAEHPKYPGEGSSGGEPPPPSPPEPLAASVAQPFSISLAVKLMWAGAALEIVAKLVGLFTGAFLGGDPPADTPGEIAGVLVGAVVNFGLWFWMAWENGLGRPYARILATILGGIGIIRALSGFFVIGAFGGGVVGLVCSLILLVLAVTILVLLWTKESTDFYKRGPETESDRSRQSQSD